MKKLKRISNRFGNYYFRNLTVYLIFTVLICICLDTLAIIDIDINMNLLYNLQNSVDTIRILNLAFFILILRTAVFITDYLKLFLKSLFIYLQKNIIIRQLIFKFFRSDPGEIYKFGKGKVLYIFGEFLSDYVEKMFLHFDLYGAVIGVCIYGVCLYHYIKATILILIVLLYIVLCVVSKKIAIAANRYLEKNIRIEKEITEEISQFMENYDHIKLCGIEENVLERIKLKCAKSEKNYNTIIRYEMTLKIADALATVICKWGFNIYIVYQCIYGEMNEWVYFILIPIFYAFLAKLECIVSEIETREKYEVLKKDIDTFFEIPDEEAYNEGDMAEIVGISIRHLTYQYMDKTICYNDYCVEDFDILFVVGDSGKGKTTLFKLLLGLLEPASGSITYTLNDRLRYIKRPRQCRDGFVFAPQAGFLYNATIRENITLGCSEYTDEEIDAAINKANAKKFIEEKSSGLDTVIEWGGKGLSGGEKQRIILARLFLRKPQIYFLDESFSSLDRVNTEKIISNMKKDGDKAFIITHDSELVERMRAECIKL